MHTVGSLVVPCDRTSRVTPLRFPREKTLCRVRSYPLFPSSHASRFVNRATCVDYTCTPCKNPGTTPQDQLANLTGVTTIICSYKYEICNRLRVEHRACRKAQGRVCKPVVKKVKQVCTRDVNRTWTKKCDEEAAKLDAGIDDLLSQLDALRRLRDSMAGGGNCGCNSKPEPQVDDFKCGADGEVYFKDDMDADDQKERKGGWLFGGDGKTRKERREEKRKQKRFSGRNGLKKIEESLSQMRESTENLLAGDGEINEGSDVAIPDINLDGLDVAMQNLDDSIAALEELIDKLKAKRELTKKKCMGADGGGLNKRVLQKCVEVVEHERLQERHEEKCAQRTAEMLVQSAKFEALVAESNRRLALLEKLQAVTDGVTDAWKDVNLTEPTFALLNGAFTDPAFSTVTRGVIDAQVVNESSLCAEILPNMQFSMLGLGISKDQILCPRPTGTFIGGRDLPDWAPHFLVGVGVVLGFFVSAFLKATPYIFAVMCEHPTLFVVLGVVVIAGRFA